jgi:signal transduction histidine kinase
VLHMQHELQENIDIIITCAEALISGQEGELTDKQEQFIRIILANAEKFIHLATRFYALPLAEVGSELRHELGNPLTPIYGYSELLMTRMIGSMSPAQRRRVIAISQSTDELRRIVDELVSKARALSRGASAT